LPMLGVAGVLVTIIAWDVVEIRKGQPLSAYLVAYCLSRGLHYSFC
jgi:hypothetical protein